MSYKAESLDLIQIKDNIDEIAKEITYRLSQEH